MFSFHWVKSKNHEVRLLKHYVSICFSKWLYHFLLPLFILQFFILATPDIVGVVLPLRVSVGLFSHFSEYVLTYHYVFNLHLFLTNEIEKLLCTFLFSNSYLMYKTLKIFWKNYSITFLEIYSQFLYIIKK